jgi:(2Fe-2S) ferredoxin
MDCPSGAVTLRCCSASGCRSAGSEALLTALRGAVASAAGAVAVKSVGCLRRCGRGPRVAIDGPHGECLYGDLAAEQAAELVAAAQAPAAPAAEALAAEGVDLALVSSDAGRCEDAASSIAHEHRVEAFAVERDGHRGLRQLRLLERRREGHLVRQRVQRGERLLDAWLLFLHHVAHRLAATAHHTEHDESSAHESSVTRSAAMSTEEDLKAEVARLKAEMEQLKARTSKGISLKVSEKGAVSVYGMGRFPVTLYKEQWLKLLDMNEDIRRFIQDNDSKLKARE